MINRIRLDRPDISSSVAYRPACFRYYLPHRVCLKKQPQLSFLFFLKARICEPTALVEYLVHVCHKRAAEAKLITILFKTFDELQMRWQVALSKGAGRVYFPIRDPDIFCGQVEFPFFIHYEIMNPSTGCQGKRSERAIQNIHGSDHVLPF